MYKLTKGIKKKVKGKKKPTQEELEQEELRQYRLEKQQEQELREEEQRKQEEQGPGEEGAEDQPDAGAASAAAGDSDKSQEKQPAESAEWAKFRALTSGVDSVLSSTKESLQTIKETSYFIRKKPTAEQETVREEKPAAVDASKPKWVDVDVEGESPESEPEPEPAESAADEAPKTPSPEKKRDLEDVLSEVEKLERAQYFEEDVFNTEYVDAVKDINLAVIPDSPVDDGDDPFDTTAVEEVLREKPEEIRKKKLKAIALGHAVDVLSGAQKHTEKSEDQQEAPAAVVPKRSRRRERGVYKRKGSLDLLETSERTEGSEDIRTTKSATVSPTKEEAPGKSLLDEDVEDGGSFELNLAVTPDFHKPQPVPDFTESKDNTSPESQNNQISDLVDEFDTKSELPKTGSNEAILTAKPPDDNDLEFDSLATESLLRAKDREEIIGDDDPFDTSAVTQVLGEEKTADIDFDEAEVKFNADFGEAQSRPVRPPPPVIITSPEKETLDFLTSNEHHDYEPLPEPIQFSAESEKKQTNTEEPQEEIDPFDTSAADKLCGTEIKLLEKELLDSSVAPVTVQTSAAVAEEDDFDFDPRAGEEKPEADPFDTSFAGGFVSEPTVNAAELLASTPTQDSTPVVLPPQQATDLNSQTEIDPFDTSIADTFGNVELKVLESELLTAQEPVSPPDLATKLDLSATSAPPRPPLPASKAETPFPVSFGEASEPKPAPPPELLTLTPEEEHVAPVALVPRRAAEVATAEEVDPFDTSIADKFGAVEVSVLEQELLGASPAPEARQLTDLLPSLADELNTETTPGPKTSQGEEVAEEERDIFDTSYVEAAGILSEVDGARFTKPSSLRVSESSAALLISTPEDPNPLLQPISATGAQSNTEEIDPFDTSAAEQFGHTELRVLESELLGEVRCSQQPPTRPAPPRPHPPRPAPPTQLPAPLPVPSADELLAVTPSAEQLPTLQPRADAPTPRPLTPVALDPFDTSIADRYGTTELRVLEQEFAGNGATSPALKRAVSDPDFDPRGEEKVARAATPPPAPVGCLLDTDTSTAQTAQTLTATVVSAPVAAEPEEVDPFDTSIADTLVPGQGEILALERELLHS